MHELWQFLQTTGFIYIRWDIVVMIIAGLVLMYLGITKNFEPLLLIPIGFGIVLGNMPGTAGLYEEGSVLNYLYAGIKYGIYPPLIFLGIGAMTDFSTLIANPKLIILGAAAQFGIFATFIGSLLLGFTITEAGSIGIIGGADGPTSIFLSSRLAPHLVGPIAIAAYSYMALVPVIQPPIIKLFTSKEERVRRMKAPRIVSKREKILFPFVGFLVTVMIAPAASILLGMLFLGNILKESGVTERLAKTARDSLVDIVTILLGLTVGAGTTAELFLRVQSLQIFALGAFAFSIATATGVIFAKVLNLFLKEKLNPMVGASGVSAVPTSARVVHSYGLKENNKNFLIMHAMAPNVAGVIGSAVAAGVLLGILGT